MSLELNGKRVMNLQEAVAWLLANNALPFQTTANYAANTEIAKTTIINPSPAEIKVGSLVLFADSKVGTVSGITTNGFMVGSDYTDIKTALNYIKNVNVNPSQHLIVTFSDDSTKDAGLIKMVSSFSIDASQHLIVNYNDGTTQDLGAIFTGNVNIAGSLTADSIIENMSGYSYSINAQTGWTKTPVYAGAVKNGNKLTLVVAATLQKAAGAGTYPTLGLIRIPADVLTKIIPFVDNVVYAERVVATTTDDEQVLSGYLTKGTTALTFNLSEQSLLTEGKVYYVRMEATFLLSDNLAA